MNLEALAAQQRVLARKVVVLAEDDPGFPAPGQNIAVLDVQYQGEKAFVAVDIVRWPDQAIVTYVCECKVQVPYQPGYFAFREGPVLKEALEKVLQLVDELALVIVDGHGTAHPRGLGVASWLGLELGIPSIGLAKESLLKFRGALPPEAGARMGITHVGEEVGRALRTVEEVKPVFVSPGHLMGLNQACRIVWALRGPYRVIEPMRRADQACRAASVGRLDVAYTWL